MADASLNQATGAAGAGHRAGAAVQGTSFAWRGAADQLIGRQADFNLVA